MKDIDNVVIGEVTADADREEVYRFRYDIYVEELGRYGDVADHANRRLVESLERQSGRIEQAVAPVEIDFENDPGSPWTMMRVRGADAPGFLYALANALAISSCPLGLG